MHSGGDLLSLLARGRGGLGQEGKSYAQSEQNQVRHACTGTQGINTTNWQGRKS